MIWLVSDEHYDHTNILKYAHRPFEDVDEMNRKLVENHNAMVKERDTVYHLGDFAWNKKVAEWVLPQLHGEHVFLRGSHERWTDAKRLPYVIEFKHGDDYVVLCHYAMLTWPRSHYGSFQFYGHSHGRTLSRKSTRQMDIGVDCSGYAPVHLSGIIESLKYWEEDQC